ncbi:MAG: hypothetical protein KF795_33100 [Labilithrix sp.]|nr:hypothetical protein [Labilithrix sp.]
MIAISAMLGGGVVGGGAGLARRVIIGRRCPGASAAGVVGGSGITRGSPIAASAAASLAASVVGPARADACIRARKPSGRVLRVLALDRASPLDATIACNELAAAMDGRTR